MKQNYSRKFRKMMAFTLLLFAFPLVFAQSQGVHGASFYSCIPGLSPSAGGKSDTRTDLNLNSHPMYI